MILPTWKCSSPEAVQLLHEGALVHSRMEHTGLRINKAHLDKAIPEIQSKIAGLEAAIKKDPVYRVWEREYGSKTSLGSPDQLRKVVFEKLGNTAKEFTRTGLAKVSRAAMDEIDLPLLRMRDQVQKLNKTLGTYLLGIRRELVEHADKEWYVHPSYNLHTASTFRPSCDSPNVMNVPKRDEEMSRFVRRNYLPLPGHHMVEIDFGTLEVEVAYRLHRDPVMGKYLAGGGDMHTDAARDLFMVDQKAIDSWDHDQKALWKKGPRDCAKNRFVFASFYGSTWITPAPDKMGTAQFTWQWLVQKKPKLPDGTPLFAHLKRKGITELGPVDNKSEPGRHTWAHHVRTVDRKLWERFRVYDQWRKDQYTEYKRRGYMEFVTGFVVHTHHKRNDVINYVVQGPAFHCLLWCLVKLDKWLRKYRLRTRIVNEVYDCMVLSVHPRELQDVLSTCKHLMTVALARAWPWIDRPFRTETEVAAVNADWSEEKLWTDESGKWRIAV